MKYAGRYNNGSGYMEYAQPAVDNAQAALSSLSGLSWADVDIVVIDDKGRETIIAWADLGKGWEVSDDWVKENTCGYCGNVNLADDGITPNWQEEMSGRACNNPYCGGLH